MSSDPEHQPASVPQGASTILDELNAAEGRGYRSQFIARDDGLVDCVQCSSASAPERFEIVHARRLEGASDPADMLMIVWTACPTCDVRGTLVLGYGPNAAGPDAALLAKLDLRAADAAPIGEAPPSADAAEGH
jgi:hypothetical protein